MKISIPKILLKLVFPVIFNIVFFLVAGTEHPASVWIAYGFIHFAYLMVLFVPSLAGKSCNAATFGFSLYSVSTIYFLTEFVVGLIFIFIGSDSYKPSLIVQVIVAGAYVALLSANLIANEHTADSITRHNTEVAYIKDTASRIKLLIGRSSDKKANKELEKTYDLLHSSPTRSSNTVKVLEAEIKNKVTELEKAVAGDEIASIITITNEIIMVTEERNRRLMLQ